VCSTETEKDFEFIFKTLKSHTLNLNPSVLIADCAEAITNGFIAAFGNNFTRVHCWFHVMKKLKEKLSVTVDAETKQQILSDIRIIQVSSTKSEFQTACSLFLKKWAKNDRVRPFLNYFEAEYLNSRSGWYEGVAPGFPSTNNGLESLNNQIKEEGTLRNKLPLCEFMNCISRLIRNWYLERDPESPNCKSFVMSPTLQNCLLSNAYTFAKLRGNCVVTQRINDKEVLHFIPSATYQKKLTKKDITTFYQNRLKFETFELWKKRLHVVKLDEKEWRNSSCTCTKFQKEYTCKHVIGIAALNKLYKIPDSAKTDLLGSRRKPGRPRKVKHALVVA